VGAGAAGGVPAVAGAVVAMSAAAFNAWGWRLPFLFSIVLIAVGLFIRPRIEESPVFRALRDQQARGRLPLIEVCRQRPRELILASFSFIANTATGYVFLAYLLSYGTTVLKVSRNLMLLVVIVGSVSWAVSIVASAVWSDRVGRKPVYLVGSVLLGSSPPRCRRRPAPRCPCRCT
jgi:MFS family permease